MIHDREEIRLGKVAVTVIYSFQRCMPVTLKSVKRKRIVMLQLHLAKQWVARLL